jgi:3',5'-cyclic AMP phosphodiesterase CpdA
MIVFAQLSDIHLDGSQVRADRAAAAVDYLKTLSKPVAAVLLTGDIADHGLPAEYEEARSLFSSLPYPVFPCPGNHDVRAAYRQALLGEAVGADGTSPVNRVHETAGALFALCDSTIPGQVGGYLADETLAWLDDVLAGNPETPAFLCFHHPPVPLHSPIVDAIRQQGEDRLAAVMARHSQVAGVLCGHAHTPAATTFAGRPLMVSPGVASTLILPWEPGDDFANPQAPVAVAFHILDDDNRLTTHYRVVP